MKKSNNISRVVHIGNNILNKKAHKVDSIDSSVQDLVDTMINTMKSEKGLGLAAPQIGDSRRVIVLDVEGFRCVMINPEIISYSEDRILITEGCLSVPDKELPIIRHKDVTIKYVDENNNEQTLSATGLLSVACQHEIDHLEGILITDRFEQQQPIRQLLNKKETYE